MQLIEGTALSKICDFSFGDQASVYQDLPNKYMSNANLKNQLFFKKIDSLYKHKNIITLFIDNIRLYSRPIKCDNSNDQAWINKLTQTNDLLKLCSCIDLNFVIFTSLEDTPIDEHIKDQIPNNVLKINAVNALCEHPKINPIPYGLQRPLSNDDNTKIIESVRLLDIKPKKLLYVNHNNKTNRKEREGIHESYTSKSWATVDLKRLEYNQFLLNILNHKFMICPIGNAIDCHRYWEVLYLKRIPIMKKHWYLEKLCKDLPVLFVDDLSSVSEDTLLNNEHLFTQIQNMNLSNLDLNNIYKSGITI